MDFKRGWILIVYHLNKHIYKLPVSAGNVHGGDLHIGHLFYQRTGSGVPARNDDLLVAHQQHCPGDPMHGVRPSNALQAEAL